MATSPRPINDPVQPCPLKCGIYTQVMEVCKDYDPVPIPQVETTVSGTNVKATQRTNRKGETEFKNLTPGGYTVSIKIDGANAESYDFTEGSMQETIPASKRSVFYFEIPTHWVKVEAAFQTGQLAPGLNYTLKHLAKPGWKPPSGTGLTARQPVLEKPAPRGDYRLEIKSVWGACWNQRTPAGGKASRVLVEEPIELYAKTCGFAAGDKGQFEILDACDLVGSPVLHKIEQAVSGEGDAQEIRTTWTPSDAQLAKLKSGSLVFRAVVEGIRAFSTPLPVRKKANFTVKDADSQSVETYVELVFVDGYVAGGKSTGGSLDIEAPFGSPLRCVRLPLLNCAHVTCDDGFAFNLP